MAKSDFGNKQELQERLDTIIEQKKKTSSEYDKEKFDKYEVKRRGNVDLKGADTNNGKKVKGILVETKGEFADLRDGGVIRKKVWRFKELNFK
jgi:hypothetical protein